MCYTLCTEEVNVMYKRLKTIRKALGYNQETFAKKIGLGKTSVSAFETGYRQLSQRNFDIICNTFNVNPDWLRNGKGEMFLPPKSPTLVNIQQEYNLSNQAMMFVQNFLELDSKQQDEFLQLMDKLF